MNSPFFQNTPSIALSSNRQTVRDLVIDILSNQKGLSSREIYDKITGYNRREVSYQAVFKTLKELEQGNIVVKNEAGYLLGSEWIQNLKKYSSSLENTALHPNFSKFIPSDLTSPCIMEFKDISELCVKTAEWIESGIFTGGKPAPHYCMIRHGWWPFRFQFSDFNLLRKMIMNHPDSKNIILLDAPFDKWISTHYKIAGFPSVCGITAEKTDCDFIVHGDVIIQAYFSPQTNELLDRVYQKISNLADLFLFYATNKISEENIEIKVVIQRNPSLAKLLREKVEEIYQKNNPVL